MPVGHGSVSTDVGVRGVVEHRDERDQTRFGVVLAEVDGEGVRVPQAHGPDEIGPRKDVRGEEIGQSVLHEPRVRVWVCVSSWL